MKAFNLALTSEDLIVINEGLQLVAFGKVAPVMQKINLQLEEQQKPADLGQPALVSGQT